MAKKSTKKPSDLKTLTVLQKDIDLLFETSWEVCNKIGGIYAVLSTKARMLKDEFGDRLVFVGPDVWSLENPSPYFKERKNVLKGAYYELQLPWGIKVRFGRWAVPGSPLVMLVNPGDTAQHLPEIYGKMWERFSVDSLHSYGDYEEACAFSVAAAIATKALTQYLKVDPIKVTSHFNEWTTGMGLLYTRMIMPQAATVFTTHATSIGRSICGNGKPLYDFFDGYNGDQMAKELNMESKHSLEKAAAHAADCFTTVSEVTARECEQLLELRPQVVTPNGFEPDFVPRTVKYNKLRREGRAILLDVANALNPEGHYDDETFFIATSGRHEYRNKGLDLFIDSIARMGRYVSNNQKVVAFVFVPGWLKEPSRPLVEAMESKSQKRIDPNFLTHRLNNEDKDEICVRLRELADDPALNRLKIIYAPCYLDGQDGIFNVPYYDMLPALDLTIFPSYYEPWGYTPLESIAFGVPTITDNKAGFGQWVLDSCQPVSLTHCGVSVVDRSDSNYSEARNAIADIAVDYILGDTVDRNTARHAAFITAAKADWKFFIKHYNEAFLIAINRRNFRILNA